MRILLDTHALLWFRQGSAQLSASARGAIEDSSIDLLLSVASLWEMAIKVNLGKLDLGTAYADYVQKCLAESDIAVLQAQPEHLNVLSELPHHHRDPFDRLMVAQCLSEGISIVSADPVFEAYGVARIW